jgi:hypothetical protein
MLKNREIALVLFPDMYMCESDLPEKIMKLDMKRLRKLSLHDTQNEEFKELSTRYKILFPPQKPSKNFSDYTKAEKELFGRPKATPKQEAVHMMTMIKSDPELSKFYGFLMKYEEVREALGNNMTIFISSNHGGPLGRYVVTIKRST